MKWLRAIFYVAVGLCLFAILPIIGDIFRSQIAFFMCLWIAIPIALGCIKYLKLYEQIKPSTATFLLKSSMWIAVILCFVIFANYNTIRDSIGYKYIKGYYSSYYPDVGDYGEDQLGVDVHTDSWYSDLFLYLGNIILFILLFAVPIITYKFGSEIVEESNQHKLIRAHDRSKEIE